MKKATIALLFLVAILFSIALFDVFVSGHQESDEYQSKANLYPASMIVTYVNYEEDTVALKDFNGQCWVFYGAEDWIVDDICACIMNDMGTDVIYDDEIVETRYCGWVE